MTLWLAVWCILIVNVAFAPSAERKALYRALTRSVWTWAGVGTVDLPFCVSAGDGITARGVQDY